MSAGARESPSPPRTRWMVRGTLYLLMAAVVVSSLLGISALLGIITLGTGGLGLALSRVLTTAIAVACACVLSMASTERWERPGGRFYASVGVIASVVGFVLFVRLLWFRPDLELSRASLSSIVLAAAGAHGALVLRAPILERYDWIRRPTLICAGVLSGLVIYLVWGDLSDPLWGLLRSENLLRIVGVLAVLTAAGTLQVTVLQRMSRVPLAASREQVKARSTCPPCDEELSDEA